MKQKEISKTLFFGCLVAVLTLVSPLVTTWGAEPAKPIVLKALRAYTWERNDCLVYREFIDRVNKKGEGRILIKDAGGSEVYPAMQQFEPLKLGTVDLLYTSTGYIAGNYPEPTILMYQFGATPDKLRSAGVFKRLDEIGRKEHGVSFFGLPWFANAHVWLNKPIKSLDELKSRKLRSHPSYDPLIKGMEIPTVTVSFAEVYTALQRGMIDGTVFPYTDLIVQGLHEVLKYRIDPPFWRAGWAILLMNAKSLDRLPEDLQKLLVNTIADLEKSVPGIYDELAAKEAAGLRAAGVKTLKLTEAEWRKTQQVAWEKGLPEILKIVSPKYSQEMIQLVAPFYPPKGPYPAID